jgi:carbonic anhydrase/acetyltransferase-like protein (isoleucine patch superfamily)
MIHTAGGKTPLADRCLFIAWNAEVCGEVSLGEDSSIWYGATIRGDIAAIHIGRGSNVQDGAVVHVDLGVPSRIGEYVTVGHRAIVHGCTIGDNCIIGMGAIILNRAEISPGCIVGAGALVTEGKRFPPGSLILGAPARVARALAPEELQRIRVNAEHYIEAARAAQRELGRGV